ncbi:MAG: tetratricopeptide repeat protein [bacterium]|nr:tetratricopeptide repeat protein [bacterium]
MNKRWLWLLPPLAAFLIYIPALSGEFVWDDLFIQQDLLPQIDAFWKVFLPYDAYGLKRFNSLWTATHKLDEFLNNAIVGMKSGPLDAARAFIPHLTGLLLHAAVTYFVTLLAWALLREMPRRMEGTLAAGLIFALHPIHVEAVAWIAGRTDSLAALFLIPALLLGMRYLKRKEPSALAGAGVLLFLALLSKEVAYSAAILLPALYLLASPGGGAPLKAGRRPAAALGLVFLAAMGGYLILRSAMGAGVGSPRLYDFSASFLRILSALALYFQKSLIPWPQLNFITTLPGLGFTLLMWAAGLAALAFALWKWRAGFALYLLAIVWFGATLAPALFVTVLQDSPFAAAERYLYLPSIGISLWAGGVLGQRREPKWSAALLAGITALSLIYGYGTVQRIGVWRSDQTLWENAVRNEPSGRGAAYAYNNLGAALQKEGKREAALSNYRKAIRIDPAYPLAHFNLGSALQKAGRIEQGEDSYRRALDLDPRYFKAYVNLGSILVKKGRIEAAISLYRRGLAHGPHRADLHYNLGNALWAGGRKSEAILSYRNAILEAPRHANAHINLGNALMAIGRPEEAAAAFREALALQPKSAIIHFNLAGALGEMGRREEADEFLRKAIELDPKLKKYLRK